ncbi:MAG TPA: EscU/YscU/HrcU family type III secretion system export apparatus switch protein [Candidatus Baltobacteraceae bacterium]
MADGGGEKHFEATQTRLERARREGNSARSQELSTIGAFAAALACCTAIARPLGAAASAALSAAAAGRCDRAALATIVALAMLPVAGAAMASLAISLVQSGGLRFVAISVKPERLAPQEGLKRICSREAAIGAVRASAAFACAAAAIGPLAMQICGAAMRGAGVASVGAIAWAGALRDAAIACAIGGAFAALDYGVQLGAWRKKLRMSFDELKRETKEHEGDPFARGRRKQLHRQFARGQLSRVRDAAFVITNPTHIAIALAYRPPDVAVPRVLVRAADAAAARVRELAAQHRIPLVENVPLARELYAAAWPGEAIPHATYVAVAEIVAALAKSGALG